MRLATSSVATSSVGTFMGSVLSTFVEDYNEIFSYRLPSHIPMDDSSDEEEQFIVYSRVDVRIVTIDSESNTN